MTMKKILLLIIGTLLFTNICYANFKIQLEKDAYTVINNSADTQFKGQSVKIENLTNEQATINLYASDAIYTTVNSLAPKPNYWDSLFMGKWIKFKENEINFEPGEEKTIPFNIDVPANSTPGTYYGEIVIKQRQGAQSASSDKNNSVSISLIDSESLALTIPGLIKNSFKLNSFGVLRTDENLTKISAEIANTGNGVISIDGDISINTQGNKKELKNFHIEPQSILQSAVKPLTFNWPNAPTSGNFQASLHLNINNFDVSTSKIEKIDSIDKIIDFTLTPLAPPSPLVLLRSQTDKLLFPLWPILVIIILLIIWGIFSAISNKNYLKNCVPYEVQPNETLENIASKFNMKWQKAAKINKIKAPYTLIAGQKILVHTMVQKTKS